jgi:hypothetical protein
MKKLALIIMLVLLTSQQFFANNYSQTVRGYVIDQDTKMPVFGVNILIIDSDPPQGASTDENGYFKIEHVQVGRISLRLSCMGYETRTIPNLMVGTGKEVFATFVMQESLISLNEIVISGATEKGEVNNEMSLISARQVTVEETQRFAGSLDDPSRMVSAFAGVTSDPLGNNDIVVRGNSPKGILWKLEGVDIPNPNHFSDESTTGGPINALSSNMLANSDFYTGAFAPEYGNALSGIFDVMLRTGNNEKPEYTLGIGVLGVDLAAEGPFKKGYSGSYLANYRYSSLGLLDNLGVVDFGGIPKYQDLSYKVNLPTNNAGTFTLFGLGGISSMIDDFSDKSEVVTEKFEYKSHMGTAGINHFYPFSPNASLKSSISISTNGSEVEARELKEGNMVPTVHGHWDKTTYLGSVSYNQKISTRHVFSTGINYDHFVYDMKDEYLDDEFNQWRNGIQLTKDAGLVQGFVSWKFRINQQLTMVSGLHYTQFMLNNASALEPRLALNWQLSPSKTLSIGYGQHSMVESIVTYYHSVYDANGVPSLPNINLGLTKSDHYVLGYEQRLSEKWDLNLEVYYQNLHSVPIENIDTSYYSLINESHGYVDKSLVSRGKGYNYGLEITLERYFFNSWYMMLSGSLFDSKYKAMDGVWRNTRYNTSYAANFLIGKEFKVGKPENGNKLNVNTKFFVNGGNRYLPVDLEKSRIKRSTVYNTSEAFKNSMGKVYQMNLTVSYSVNRPKVRHEIYLDIYNVFNNQAPVEQYYDKNKDEIGTYTQLNMIPNIMYKIHF